MPKGIYLGWLFSRMLCAVSLLYMCVFGRCNNLRDLLQDNHSMLPVVRRARSTCRGWPRQCLADVKKPNPTNPCLPGVRGVLRGRRAGGGRRGLGAGGGVRAQRGRALAAQAARARRCCAGRAAAAARRAPTAHCAVMCSCIPYQSVTLCLTLTLAAFIGTTIWHRHMHCCVHSC